MSFLTYLVFSSGWVVALGWGVRRFHNNISMFSNPTSLVNRKTPYLRGAIVIRTHHIHKNLYIKLFFAEHIWSLLLCSPVK